jgi:hypothetical protein
MNLASWWRKRKKDFEIYDADAFLDSHLAFYQRHKLELDVQCKKWLAKLARKEKTDRSIQEEIEIKKMREFSEE